ncbi:hypothetical protein ACERZ8_12350 [Tateyamaria armeniaca]|uniref:DUF3035 domain-containing protein n=1 Tax=Tateyamaria armeniaca TaxID=2518930 RepID=A0ABW8UUS1_9RHOB
MIRAATLFLFLTLAACAQFPELDGTVAPDLENADFPDLVPLEPLLARTAPVVADPVETSEALDARVAALRARAAALQRREIVDQDAENRLNTARN